VAAVRDTPLAVFVAVTVALAITPPDASVTIPVMVAFVV
jgi:hypothetical protein